MDTFYPEKNRTRPRSQFPIVMSSIVIFMIYFCILREENEIDEMMTRTLDESVPNVIEMTLRHQIAQYENMGLDTNSLKEKLNEERLKKKNDVKK